MIKLLTQRCSDCAYSQASNVEGDPLWCRIHMGYFEQSDQCFDFSINNLRSAQIQSVYGNLVRWPLNNVILWHSFIDKSFKNHQKHN